MSPNTPVTTEESFYYSAKVHNTAPKAQKVKVYYESAEPKVEQRIVEDVQVIEPRKEAVFAPRTYMLDNAERKYNVSRVELLSEQAEVQPVVFNTRTYRAEPRAETCSVRISEADGAYTFEPYAGERVIYE